MLPKLVLAEPTTAIVRGSTHENRPNLAPAFFEKILATYEGTRLGRQEIYAELLEVDRLVDRDARRCGRLDLAARSGLDRPPGPAR